MFLQYSCHSCCDDAKVSNEFNKLKNADGMLTKYSIFDFSGCDAAGNKVQNGKNKYVFENQEGQIEIAQQRLFDHVDSMSRRDKN